MPKLPNPKRERFCHEYIKDLNRTKAAIRARYSKRTAKSIGQRLLTFVDIQKRIAELMDARAKRTQTTQDQVLEELKILAHSDFRDFGTVVKESGDKRLKLKTFKQIKGNATRAIKSITERVSKDGVTLIFKLHGKVPALELIGKHIGMFTDLNIKGRFKHEYILSMKDFKESNKKMNEDEKSES